MYNYHGDIKQQELKRQAIYDEVRHIHLANRLHRAQKANQIKKAGGWLHVLTRLHRIHIQISFDLEDPNPELTGAR